MTFDTDASLGYLVAYAPRVTVLPFLLSLWLDGRAGFALAATLVWHFVVAVPWYGLADCATVHMRTAYFIVMPIIAAAFALLGWALRNWFLKLPPHMTPVGHFLRWIRKGEKANESHDDASSTPLPSTFPGVSVAVSLLTAVGAWLPSELLVHYGYSPSAVTGPLFWVNVFLPPGAQLIPFVMWLAYGSQLKKLFGEKHELREKFTAFAKCFLVTGLVSTSFALIAKYASGTILWLWVGAIIVAPGTLGCAFLYHQLSRGVSAHDYEKYAIY